MKKYTTAASVLALLMFTSANAQDIEPAENPAFAFHRLAKRYMYSQLTIQAGRDVLAGKEQPLLPFNVLQDPPSVFVNFEIAPEKVQALVDYLDFPNGLALTPIAIIDGEDPRFYLTLNIYAVWGLRGLLSGNRAEWSVYVAKPGDRPSYMVVDAKASELTLDSVNWFTAGTELQHARTKDGIRSFAASDEGSSFHSLITQAGIQNAERVFPATTWVSANDRIYWRNGVTDRTYYDGNFVDTPVLSVDPEEIYFADTTIWRQFVHPQPVNVLVYETGFELVISPWYNVDPE